MRQAIQIGREARFSMWFVLMTVDASAELRSDGVANAVTSTRSEEALTGSSMSSVRVCPLQFDVPDDTGPEPLAVGHHRIVSYRQAREAVIAN